MPQTQQKGKRGEISLSYGYINTVSLLVLGIHLCLSEQGTDHTLKGQLAKIIWFITINTIGFSQLIEI